ncbi:MAG: DUF3810 domain-containing protein [Eubacteriales bacterium]|nr:DUF3810 domain-containing protein [Eubacteriales bacterium]
MKYWFGYLTAAIFGAITWVLMEFGERFSSLVDMVYPYVIRTLQGILAQWTGAVAFPVWQLLALVLGVLILASFVLMIALKWNPIEWFGWVLAVFAGIYLLHTGMWGLNYYAGTLAQDLRLETSTYTLEELTEATEYYRDQANALAKTAQRGNGSSNVQFEEFEVLAAKAGDGFKSLTYDYHYPVFAGSTLPVKKLGWADMYTSMGITGFTFGITGEAAVNPQIPDISLPFTMCHEMAHRMCIANERDANFAGFLACSANPDPQFRYSGYFMAFRYCFNALNRVSGQQAAAAVARVKDGISQELQFDMDYYDRFFADRRDQGAASLADTVNDTYLKTSGDKEGIASYSAVYDLLVNWHIQTVVLPEVSVEQSPFDPYDESQVDLSGNVNARG